MPTLDWVGKSAVVNHDKQIPYRMIHCDGGLSIGDAGEGNLLVEGDNLEALKALQPYYAGKVKCIYIDPPYNTGNKDWAYNDNVNTAEIKAWVGKEVGGPEDFTHHDKWLCMMYPRLQLLRGLLREDGAIFVSIGFQEVAHLRCMMDEIFGADNFLAQVAWQKVYSTRMDAKNFSDDVDYIIVYARSEKFQIGKVRFTQNKKQFNLFDQATSKFYRRRSWRKEGKNSRRVDRPNLYYKMVAPDGSDVYPTRSDGSEGRWRGQYSHFENLQSLGLVEWAKVNGEWQIYIKQIYDDEAARPASTLWPHTEVGHNHEASEEIKRLFGRLAFDTPKPTRLIEQIVRLSTGSGSNDIVLDSFAGSGATGHSVMEVNAEDNGSRRFILIEMKSEISREVTAERLRLAIQGHKLSVLSEDDIDEDESGEHDVYEADKAAEGSRASLYDVFSQVTPSARSGGSLPFQDEELAATHTPSASGMGGGFRYCTLGVPLFDKDGKICPEVLFSDLAHHIYFTETGEPLPQRANEQTPHIGTANGVAYYLLWNGAEGECVLDMNALRTLPPHDGAKIIYADGCCLPAERLIQAGVIFKQVPYEVKVR